MSITICMAMLVVVMLFLGGAKIKSITCNAYSEMAKDMIEMNSDNIEKSLLQLYKSIGDLTHGEYLNQIKDIRSNRQKMFL